MNFFSLFLNFISSYSHGPTLLFSWSRFKGLFTWSEGAPAHRATRLEGLKHSPPLHGTHLTGTASELHGQSFERSLTKTNKMADKTNFLAASLIFFFAHSISGGFSVPRVVALHFANDNYKKTQLAPPCLSMFSRLISPRLSGIAWHQPFTW